MPNTMNITTAIREYAVLAFKWQRGRQGTGYDKMLLLTARWLLAARLAPLPKQRRQA